jgi:hypothetical protein
MRKDLPHKKGRNASFLYSLPTRHLGQIRPLQNQYFCKKSGKTLETGAESAVLYIWIGVSPGRQRVSFRDSLFFYGKTFKPQPIYPPLYVANNQASRIKHSLYPPRHPAVLCPWSLVGWRPSQTQNRPSKIRRSFSEGGRPYSWQKANIKWRNVGYSIRNSELPVTNYASPPAPYHSPLANYRLPFNLFVQNKPNLHKPRIWFNLFACKALRRKRQFLPLKNKPKQTQTKPIRPPFFARQGTPKPKRTQTNPISKPHRCCKAVPPGRDGCKTH